MKFEFFNECKNLNELKKNYWQLAKKFHPDVNPTGSETMKRINNEYELAFSYIEKNATVEEQKQYNKQGHNINDNYRDIINSIINLPDIIIELCGSWIWISGETRKYKNEIKAAGFFWAPKKVQWYWRPEEYKASRYKKSMPMQHIRDKYGSLKVENKPFQQVKSA